MTGPFVTYDDADVRDLIHEYPLAWICAPDVDPGHATMLPLLGEYNESGRLTHLLGHSPRRSPLVAALRADGRARILFQGPQGYVSPEQAGLRDWAPTWNYAQLSIEADLTFLPEETGASVAALTDAMERGRADPWQVIELGDRYAAMAAAIIAFRARVIHVAGRFKLGQDERPEVREAIIATLGDTPLARWVRRFARDAAGD
jgi:transcriptional regulator